MIESAASGDGAKNSGCSNVHENHARQRQDCLNCYAHYPAKTQDVLPRCDAMPSLSPPLRSVSGDVRHAEALRVPANCFACVRVQRRPDPRSLVSHCILPGRLDCTGGARPRRHERHHSGCPRHASTRQDPFRQGSGRARDDGTRCPTRWLWPIVRSHAGHPAAKRRRIEVALPTQSPCIPW